MQLNTSNLIYAGGALIAEVGGTQNAVPQYRMTDNLGSTTSVSYAPYGQIFSGSTSDVFGFTGLQSDATTATYHATARQFSPQQGRWQSPDPYSGSYNWADPQSLNRYAYVNGRPMAFTDPSGQDGCAGSAVVLAFAGPWGEAGAGAVCVLEFAFGIDKLKNLLNPFSTPDFHGSLKPRPSNPPMSETLGPMSETLGMPTGWKPQGGLAGIWQRFATKWAICF